MSGNRDPMTRALKMVFLFNTRNLTVKQVAEELDVTLEMAARWICRASLVMPITEVGKFKESRGRPPVIYGLMRD